MLIGECPCGHSQPTTSRRAQPQPTTSGRGYYVPILARWLRAFGGVGWWCSFAGGWLYPDQAAVDDYVLAGHIAIVGAYQPGGSFCHFSGCCQAVEGYFISPFRELGLAKQFFGGFGASKARGYAIYQDVVLGKLGGKRCGEAVDGEFGRAIERALFFADNTPDAAQIQYSAVVALNHAWQSSLGDVCRCSEIDRKHLFKVLVLVVDELAWDADSSVVYEYVWRYFPHQLTKALQALRRGKVRLDYFVVAGAHNGLRRCASAEYFDASINQFHSNGFANPLGRTGYYGYLWFAWCGHFELLSDIAPAFVLLLERRLVFEGLKINVFRHQVCTVGPDYC